MAMVEYFCKLTKGHITHNHFMEMTQTIINELPDEDPRTWYTPAVQNKTAGGMLYNRYRYIKQHDHRYKQQKPAVEPVPETSQKIPQTAWDKMSFEERSLCEAAKTKLLVTGYSESDIITKCWRESFPLRRKEALSGKIIFKDWEVLAHYANIHDLINFDFREVHGSSKDTLTTQAAKFIQVFSRVHIGYRELIKEDQTLADTIATSFAANVSINDHTVFLVFYSLPLILRQQFVTKQKKTNKNINPCMSQLVH